MLKENTKERWEQWIVEVQMSKRPTTRPGKTGSEGYPVSVMAIRKVRNCVAPAHKIETDKRNTDWRQAGKPHHILWWFKESDGVTAGMNIPCDGVWDNTDSMQLKLWPERVVKAAPPAPTNEQLKAFLEENGYVLTKKDAVAIEPAPEPAPAADDIAAALDAIENEPKKRGRKPQTEQ